MFRGGGDQDQELDGAALVAALLIAWGPTFERDAPEEEDPIGG